MNLYGWIFMSISWLIIIGMISFCFYRVLIEKEEEL